MAKPTRRQGRVEAVVTGLLHAALYHLAAFGLLHLGGPTDEAFAARPPVVQAGVILGVLGCVVARTLFVMGAVAHLFFHDTILAVREEDEADGRDDEAAGGGGRG
jgi:hypothetical protein